MQLVVAQVAGANGLKGHVSLLLRTDAPEQRFRTGVILDTDRDDLPELTIDDVRGAGRSWQLHFEEIRDRTAAEALKGMTLMIETDEWEDEEESWYDSDLEGLPAVHVDGTHLGVIADVEHGTAQDLLLVRTPTGDVRVPFVRQLVPEVRQDAVVIDPPGGLFDGEEAPSAD